jgi:hypothetical protein
MNNMSMLRGCITVEWAKGEHYCITAHNEYDEEFKSYTVTGPKPTAEQAFESHDGCNPGQCRHIAKQDKKLSEAYEPWILKAIRQYKKNKRIESIAYYTYFNK